MRVGEIIVGTGARGRVVLSQKDALRRPGEFY